MTEDLSAPYPGYGLGAMDAYDGYVVYQLLAPELLTHEIHQMRELVHDSYGRLTIDQDLGLGMMLWLTHFFPDEEWAVVQRSRCLVQLERLWIHPPGYFCRQESWNDMKFAFTNYGISLGLQSVGRWSARVDSLNTFFEAYRSDDEYDTNAITHVMACSFRLIESGVFSKRD